MQNTIGCFGKVLKEREKLQIELAGLQIDRKESTGSNVGKVDWFYPRVWISGKAGEGGWQVTDSFKFTNFWNIKWSSWTCIVMTTYHQAVLDFEISVLIHWYLGLSLVTNGYLFMCGRKVTKRYMVAISMESCGIYILIWWKIKNIKGNGI